MPLQTLGYPDIGQARTLLKRLPLAIGRRGPRTPPQYPTPPGQTTEPALTDPRQNPPGMAASRGVPVTPNSSRYGRLPGASQPRWNFATGRGVAAQTPQLASLAAMHQGAVPFSAGTRGANVVNPLFGRPIMGYSFVRPSVRVGPVAKLSVGTGRTAATPTNRAQGFVLPAHATEQYLPTDYYDYTPPTDPNVAPGFTAQKPGIARTINVGSNGRELVGTYNPHDFTPASRFFTQGRSSAAWQDYSFGPDYRWLTAWQYPAKYNLYNGVALSGVLNPNVYSLGVVTQPSQAAALGNSGMGRPLGY